MGLDAYMLVHTDDFLVSCSAMDIYGNLIDRLGTRMDIKRIGLAKSALGLIIEQNPGHVHITQANYVSKVLSLIRPPTLSSSTSATSSFSFMASFSCDLTHCVLRLCLDTSISLQPPRHGRVDGQSDAGE